MDTTQPQMTDSMAPKKGGNAGSIIAIILILAVLIVGGIYYFTTAAGKLGANDMTQQALDNGTAQPDTQTEQLSQQSSSDDLNAIQADVSSTNVGDLNQGSESIQVQ